MTGLPALPHRLITAGVLDMAYGEVGASTGWPVVLVHGFPYDPHCFAEAADLLAAHGARVIMPWQRGYGPTRFRSAATLRSGQQGALGADLLALLDALSIDRAILGGFDWGGRAACVVSALWPDRVSALVSAEGYNILDVDRSAQPVAPEIERRLWYVWYLQTERGRAGLDQSREAFCRLLWQTWSPGWTFSAAEFARSAAAFANPDFVEVVVHSYRHRHRAVAGDPAYAEIEERLRTLPPITVPAVVIRGGNSGLSTPGHFADISRFEAGCEVRTFTEAGHNPAQENPQAFAEAVLQARAMAKA